MMNVFRIGTKDDQCARLADLHILDYLARGVKLDVDGEHADTSGTPIPKSILGFNFIQFIPVLSSPFPGYSFNQALTS